MIVLNEFGCNTCRGHFTATIGLGQKSAGIAMNFRNDELDLSNVQRTYLHHRVLADHAIQVSIGDRSDREKQDCGFTSGLEDKHIRLEDERLLATGLRRTARKEQADNCQQT